jgi:hypothetical protein
MTRTTTSTRRRRRPPEGEAPTGAAIGSSQAAEVARADHFIALSCAGGAKRAGGKCGIE